jgi:hypothetical protein
MGLWPRAALAGSLGFAVACLAACGGGSGLLSSDQANGLSNKLDHLSAAVSAHDCGSAANAVQSLNRAVFSLPSTVNVTLRQDLQRGASTVGELALRDCQQTSSTTTPTAPTTRTNTTTTQTSTTTTTTTTTPTQTSTTTTTPATTTSTTGTTSTSTTPSGGGGLGGGGSVGGGNGTGLSGGATGNGNGNSNG